MPSPHDLAPDSKAAAEPAFVIEKQAATTGIIAHDAGSCDVKYAKSGDL
jgi:hypothetical protein